jgi:Kef-type K+ transport system membrane component KefB
MVIETMAYLGLLFYVFLTGLEMDLSAILRPGKKVMGIAITGILIPFLVGVGLFFLLHHDRNEITLKMGCVFWAAALTITGFPVLTRILADLKLLHSDIGRIAMSVAMLNDIYAWVLIAILIPTGESPVLFLKAYVVTTYLIKT